VTVTDKALILGFLLTGLVTYSFVGNGEESAGRAVAVRSNGRLAFRLPATDASHETDAAVIEQPDGLLVVDDSLTPGQAVSTVARIRSSSEKPVKFLIYSHDKGDRTIQDRAYREAWPNIVIISTADEPATGVFREAASSVLTLGQDYAADRFRHLRFLATAADALQSVAEGFGDVVGVYKAVSHARIRLSFAAPKRAPCNDG
jgi:hypothetical protein